MKTIKVKPKYEAWLTTSVMHKDSLKWLSELKFIKDEEQFFNDLIKFYTLKLIESKNFYSSKNIVSELIKIENETNDLINLVLRHERGLGIMVDNVNSLEEENAYKVEHGKLIITVSDFFDQYKALKSELFLLIKTIIKDSKQKRLAE
jgi:hypothetical protein